jgi:molybdenum cofactor biosynthesis enzyme
VKAVDRTMVISNIHLVEKSGGRSGLYKRAKLNAKKRIS